MAEVQESPKSFVEYDTAAKAKGKTAKTSGRGDLERIAIEMADNGYTVTFTYAPKRRAPGMMIEYNQLRDERVYNDPNDMLMEIGKRCGVKVPLDKDEGSKADMKRDEG